MTSSREMIVAIHEDQREGAETLLAPARLRARWLPRRLLLWMIPAAAALAGIAVFVPAQVDDRPKPTVAEAALPVEAPVVAEAPVGAEARTEGPETTGSFGRAPSPSLARREGASPPVASGASPAAPPTVSASPPPPVQPTRMAALPSASEPRDEAMRPSGPPEANPASVQPSLSLTPEDIAAHLARGEERLKVGDVAAARLYFERAALAGERRGALGMARTYDPEVLADLPVLGPQADPVVAKTWYDRAASERSGG